MPELLFNVAGRNCPLWLKQFMFEHQVGFHGEIENSEMFYSVNSIMVVPLFSGSGMRVKIIEGMGYGKTVVTTLMGAEGIAVTHGENIVLCNSRKEFIDEIMNLVRHPSLFHNIGKNAREFIRLTYNHEKICRELHEFYLQHV
jgi:glycosyltransferase involved in cell wall biosynthesis